MNRNFHVVLRIFVFTTRNFVLEDVASYYNTYLFVFQFKFSRSDSHRRVQTRTDMLLRFAFNHEATSSNKNFLVVNTKIRITTWKVVFTSWNSITPQSYKNTKVHIATRRFVFKHEATSSNTYFLVVNTKIRITTWKTCSYHDISYWKREFRDLIYFSPMSP